MYAVIKTGGKQYRVAPQDVIEIEKVDGKVGDSVEFSEVLMLAGEGDAQVGTPLLDGVTVAGEVVEQGRGDKIIVFKKKRRKNYRRRKGHRQYLTTVRITDILTGGKKPAAKKSAKPKETPAAETTGTAELTPLFETPEGPADDLTRISGVGPVIAKKLAALGVTTFAQVAAFTEEDVARVDEQLNFKGRIEREEWIEQATELAKGNAEQA